MIKKRLRAEPHVLECSAQFYQKGVTLLELIVALSVASILLLVALPSYGPFVSQSRVDTVTNQLISTVSIARSEAIKRGQAVAVCSKNADPAQTCVPAANGAQNWSDGWIVFTDADDNQVAAANEIIKVFGNLDDASTVQFSNGTTMVFDSLGLLSTASVNDETFTVGDNLDAAMGAGLSVTPTGRIRTCKNWSVSSATCSD